MACGVAAFAQPTTNDVWINEFHYDGITTFDQPDQNEFLEIVIRKTLYNNTAEFAKLKVVLYTAGALDQATLNSGSGLPYNESSLLYSLAETELPLTSFQACNTTSSDYMILSKPVALQDIPAGFALVYNNTTVVQLLSYEKRFTIAPADEGGGAAAGLTTTVIRTAAGDTAMETAQTPNTHSISLIGAGVSYNNFSWTDQPSQTATPCQVNAGQTLASSAPLPVRWLDFKASGNGDQIMTSWIVADDELTAQYEVEIKGASFNAFTRQAAVARQASAGGKYGQTLQNVPAGIYTVRIKAIETDGRFYYSAERMVRIGKGLGSLTIYPNPVQNNRAFLQFAAGENSIYNVQVIDATGRIVKQQSLGAMTTNQVNNMTLNLQGVLPGTYQVKVKGTSEEMNARIVVVQ